MRLARLYETGMGVGVNGQIAFELYMKALNLGKTEAAIHLGNYYETGFGVEKNYSEARKMYRMLIGKSGGTAECRLGVLYRDGLGADRDNSTAEHWFKLAIRAGNREALSHLGKMYIGKELDIDNNIIGCAYIYHSYVEKDIAYCDSLLTAEQKGKALGMELPVYE
jgi:hypothetical protein